MFTKGPWVRSSLADAYIISQQEVSPVCSIGEYDEAGNLEMYFVNYSANARLIAQAPAMAELLRLVAETRITGCLRVDVVEQVEKILAEIDGGQ